MLFRSYLWKKHSKKESEAINGEQVVAKRLNKQQWLILTAAIIIAYVGYSFILREIGSNFAGLDGLAVVLSVLAQILMILRFAEQWVLWIIINVLSVALWIATLTTSDGNDWTVLAMWVAFLINSIYGYVNWLKISKDGVKNV